MPITFLTWNINQKDCLQPLKEILNDFQVDILLLNESLLDNTQIYNETGLKRMKLTQVIVFGNFNINPFDKGMIHPNGFNSVSDKNTAKITRKFNIKTYNEHYLS